MADEKKPDAKPGVVRGWFKAVLGAVVGLGSGVLGVYATAIVDKVAKPAKPVANFAVAADGLTVTCQNHASGESGWWDFGDGTPLEPFDAALPSVAHTYAKPGTYAVILTVRNFLMEENDRRVPVDLSQASAAQAQPPAVTGLTVEPIGPRAIAPAAFRVRGEVKNADRVLLDLGEKVEVTTDNGQFERLVVFEKPGQFPIQLTGLSGKTAVKQSQMVRVEAAAAGSLSVVLRVTDTAAQVERKETPVTVALPLPAKGAKPGMEKMIPAQPGFTITEVKVGKVASAAMKNLKAEMTADKRAVKLTGEWTATGDGATKAAGGSDVVVPLTLVQERTVSRQGATDSMAAAMGLEQTAAGLRGSTALKPRSQPLGTAGVQRRMALEIRQATADGQSTLLAIDPDVKFPWAKQVAGAAVSFAFKAEQVGDQVLVSMTSAPGR